MLHQEKNKMDIKNKLEREGFSINLLKDYKLYYPKSIWQSLDTKTKKIIADTISYLKISPYSMFLDKDFLFDFSKPFLKEKSLKSMK